MLGIECWENQTLFLPSGEMLRGPAKVRSGGTLAIEAEESKDQETWPAIINHGLGGF